jgi:hypothetical protein|tara:strand:+ start:1669 stop:2193 length:525 start_codon:yes stop_codon:yes gene_type:complete
MPKVFYGVVDIKHIAIEDRPMKINITRKISLCIIALAGFTLGGCTMSMSANQAPEAVVNPPIYQKEVLISTGYANISAQKSKSPAQQRLMAIRVSKLDAYRNLTEQVYGQNINATSTVADMVLASDTMRAHVEGIVYGAKVVSISPIGDDSYETKLELALDTMLELRRTFLVAR